MKKKINFSVQLDLQTRGLLNRLAENEERKPGDYLRFLIRREGKKLPHRRSMGEASRATQPA